MRRHAWVLFLVLLAGGIPWYWPAADRTLVFGVPAWVAAAVLGGALTAAVTVWYLLAPWPGETGPGDDDEP